MAVSLPLKSFLCAGTTPDSPRVLRCNAAKAAELEQREARQHTAYPCLSRRYHIHVRGALETMADRQTMSAVGQESRCDEEHHARYRDKVADPYYQMRQSCGIAAAAPQQASRRREARAGDRSSDDRRAVGQKLHAGVRVNRVTGITDGPVSVRLRKA